MYPKKHLIFWVAYVWLEGSPKSRLVAGGTPNVYKEGRSTRLVEGSSKEAVVSLIVLRLSYNLRGQHGASSKYPCCPIQKTENGHFPTWSGFWVSGAGHCNFWEDGSFYSMIFQIHCRTETLPQFFWTFFLQAEIWGRFCGPSETKSEKIVCSQGADLKIREQKLPPP